MKYGMHNEKYDHKASGGIYKEQFREYEHKEYANYVDHALTHENVYGGKSDWEETIELALEMTAETTGKKVRANTIVVDSMIETVPSSWDRESVLEYFERQDNMLKELYQEQGVDTDKWYLSSVIHFDESNPHRTFTIIPMQTQEDGSEKLCNKQVVNQYFLTQSMSRGWDVYQEFAQEHPELELMEKYEIGSNKEHLNDLEYKCEQEQSHLDELEQQMQEQQQAMEDLQQSFQRQLEIDENIRAEAKKVIEPIDEPQFEVQEVRTSFLGEKEQMVMLDDVQETLEAAKEAVSALNAQNEYISQLEHANASLAWQNRVNERYIEKYEQVDINQENKDLWSQNRQLTAELDNRTEQYNELVNNYNDLLDQSNDLANENSRLKDVVNKVVRFLEDVLQPLADFPIIGNLFNSLSDEEQETVKECSSDSVIEQSIPYDDMWQER